MHDCGVGCEVTHLHGSITSISTLWGEPEHAWYMQAHDLTYKK